jgi:hypothetical protein
MPAFYFCLKLSKLPLRRSDTKPASQQVETASRGEKWDGTHFARGCRDFLKENIMQPEQLL